MEKNITERICRVVIVLAAVLVMLITRILSVDACASVESEMQMVSGADTPVLEIKETELTNEMIGMNHRLVLDTGGIVLITMSISLMIYAVRDRRG